MDTFVGSYSTVLHQYQVKTTNTASDTGLQEVSQKVYSMAQEVGPRAFLQWNWSAGENDYILSCCTQYTTMYPG